MRVIMIRGEPVQSYWMPKDGELFKATWWRISDAAKAWGVSRTTAKRLIDRHGAKVGRFVVYVRTWYGESLRVVIPRDTPRPSGKAGNPNFRGTQNEYERELSYRRWRPDELPPAGTGVVAQRARAARKARADRKAARIAQAEIDRQQRMLEEQSEFYHRQVEETLHPIRDPYWERDQALRRARDSKMRELDHAIAVLLQGPPW